MSKKPDEKSSKKPISKCKDGSGGGGGSKDAAAKTKFVMRNAHLQKSLQNVYVAVGVALSSAALFYVFHNRRRKLIYKKFYENYDAEEAYNRMAEGGWMTQMDDGGGDDKKKKK